VKLLSALTISVGLILLAFFVVLPPAYADYYFSDEFNEETGFNSPDPSKWTAYPNLKQKNYPTINQTGGYIYLRQFGNAPQFPYITSKANPFPDTNWSTEISFQYTKVTPWGTGIVMGENAPENGEDFSPVLDISVWQDKSLNNLRIDFNQNNVYTTFVTTSPHIFKVERIGQKYLVYLDNNLIYTSPDTAKQIDTIWFGNPTFQNPPIPNWTEFKLDYIRISHIPPANPVIFIPGIGGSEFKANQDIIWSKEDGHGGVFSHAYKSGEKIWVNQDEAAMPGEDDYFDVLRLKPDGETPEADLVLTGELTSFGYPDIDSFFEEIGYKKGANFFVYPYDWRKDIRTTKEGLDVLIDKALEKSGKEKVNIVAHSMGGLVARWYIADKEKAAKVNKLINMGTPHLGAVKALKANLYGTGVFRNIFFILNFGIPGSEVKDLFENYTSAFELQPSQQYFNFYDNSTISLPYPFFDDRDIDNNQEVGALDFNQLNNLLINLNYNSVVSTLAQQFHSFLDPIFNQNNGTKLYHIVGSNQPTLGQIKEGWLINWPIKLINRYDELYINGDGTVPLYSASLKNSSRDLSAGAELYYVDQTHEELVDKSGSAMEAVKVILAELDIMPVEVKDEKITLEGKQISVDQDAELDLYNDSNQHTGLNTDGNIEINIPGTFYDTFGNSKHVFIKKQTKPVNVKIKKKTSGKTNIKIRHYQDDKVAKTTIYQEVPVNNSDTVEFIIDTITQDSPLLIIDEQIIPPTSEIIGDHALDQTPPITSVEIEGTQNPVGGYLPGAIITLNSSDSESGILQTDYSLDDEQTRKTYTTPFTVDTPGIYTLQVTSVDKLGNQEKPKTTTIIVANLPAATPTMTPIPTLKLSNSGSLDHSETKETLATLVVSITPLPPQPVVKLVKTIQKYLPSQEDKTSEKEILGEKISSVSADIISPAVIANKESTNLREILLIPVILTIVFSTGLILTFTGKGAFLKKIPK